MLEAGANKLMVSVKDEMEIIKWTILRKDLSDGKHIYLKNPLNENEKKEMRRTVMNQIQSETIGKLAEALAKAQGKFKTAVKDKKNPHFKSSYASYESVRDACQGALSAEGISIAHLMDIHEGKRVMITQLTHVSGEWIRSYLALPVDKETPQGIGSSVTYAMRYSLSSILCIPSGDGDDDGEAAEIPHREEPKTLSAAQIKVIEGLIGEDIEFLNNILKVNRKLSLKDIPADQFDIIMQALRSR